MTAVGKSEGAWLLRLPDVLRRRASASRLSARAASVSPDNVASMHLGSGVLSALSTRGPLPDAAPHSLGPSSAPSSAEADGSWICAGAGVAGRAAAARQWLLVRPASSTASARTSTTIARSLGRCETGCSMSHPPCVGVGPCQSSVGPNTLDIRRITEAGTGLRYWFRLGLQPTQAAAAETRQAGSRTPMPRSPLASLPQLASGTR